MPPHQPVLPQMAYPFASCNPLMTVAVNLFYLLLEMGPFHPREDLVGIGPSLSTTCGQGAVVYEVIVQLILGMSCTEIELVLAQLSRTLP